MDSVAAAILGVAVEIFLSFSFPQNLLLSQKFATTMSNQFIYLSCWEKLDMESDLMLCYRSTACLCLGFLGGIPSRLVFFDS